MKNPATARKAERHQRAETLYATIRGLAESNRLLGGVHIDVEQIAKKKIRGVELVTLDFAVPEDISETRDPRTGIIRATSGGAHFTYTFSSEFPLEENLSRFGEFYSRRSVAVQQFPPLRRRAQATAAAVAAEPAEASW